MKIRDRYDVIIAGAGPGGASAAKNLAKRGHSVLLLEKRQEIGSPKRCGEGISVATARIFGRIPDKCIARPIDGAVAYAPDGSRVVMDFGRQDSGYVVERKVFDKWLSCKASEAGATVVAKSEVTDVVKDGRGYVTGVRARIIGDKERTIKARVVVAADGIESTIARKAGLETANKLVNLDSGYQYEMSNLKIPDDKKIHMYFGNEVAPRGYVWIFPKGDGVANVGIGTAFAEKPAKDYLDAFIEKHPEIFGKAGIIEVNSGGIPVGGFLDSMVLDGFLVVGDAAHQVNPIHGGGMKEATIAGEMAADVISKCIKKGDVSKDALSEYDILWWKERGQKLEKVEKLRQVVEKLSDNDLNMLAKSLDGDVIIELSRGNKLATLAKLLMKKPRLIKLARHLL